MGLFGSGKTSEEKATEKAAETLAKGDPNNKTWGSLVRKGEKNAGQELELEAGR